MSVDHRPYDMRSGTIVRTWRVSLVSVYSRAIGYFCYGP